MAISSDKGQAKPVFLAGVSCVGKTTVGKELAALTGCDFFDLDIEVERFYGKPISVLQAECFGMAAYREKASQALAHVLSRARGKPCVIALPPSGLMDPYWRVVKKAAGPIVVLTDNPENILARIRFYDKDSRPIEKRLTAREKALCLQEIKKDMAYFGRSYRKADITVDLAGLDPRESALNVAESLALATSSPILPG